MCNKMNGGLCNGEAIKYNIVKNLKFDDSECNYKDVIVLDMNRERKTVSSVEVSVVWFLLYEASNGELGNCCISKVTDW